MFSSTDLSCFFTNTLLFIMHFMWYVYRVHCVWKGNITSSYDKLNFFLSFIIHVTNSFYCLFSYCSLERWDFICNPTEWDIEGVSHKRRMSWGERAQSIKKSRGVGESVCGGGIQEASDEPSKDWAGIRAKARETQRPDKSKQSLRIHV